MEHFPTVLWNLVHLKDSMLSDLFWWPVNNEGQRSPFSPRAKIGLWEANKLIKSVATSPGCTLYIFSSSDWYCVILCIARNERRTRSASSKGRTGKLILLLVPLNFYLLYGVSTKTRPAEMPRNESPHPSFPTFPAFIRPCAPKICS